MFASCLCYTKLALVSTCQSRTLLGLTVRVIIIMAKEKAQCKYVNVNVNVKVERYSNAPEFGAKTAGSVGSGLARIDDFSAKSR